MPKAIRYEIELHPDLIDCHRQTPSAWLCTGYDEQGEVLERACGSSASDALANTLSPFGEFVIKPPPSPWWRRILAKRSGKA
jgi:hypothetical protein